LVVAHVISVFILLFKDDRLLSEDDYICASDFSAIRYLCSTQNKAYYDREKEKKTTQM